MDSGLPSQPGKAGASLVSPSSTSVPLLTRLALEPGGTSNMTSAYDTSVVLSHSLPKQV